VSDRSRIGRALGVLVVLVASMAGGRDAFAVTTVASVNPTSVNLQPGGSTATVNMFGTGLDVGSATIRGPDGQPSTKVLVTLSAPLTSHARAATMWALADAPTGAHQLVLSSAGSQVVVPVAITVGSTVPIPPPGPRLPRPVLPVLPALRPDLVVETVAVLRPPPGLGRPTTARVVVRNRGSAPAVFPADSIVWRARVGLVRTGGYRAPAAGLTIGAGTAVALEGVVARPTAPPPGTHVVRISVDPDGLVAESDETNNVRDVTVVVLP
jgi:hypothetical protein